MLTNYTLILLWMIVGTFVSCFIYLAPWQVPSCVVVEVWFVLGHGCRMFPCEIFFDFCIFMFYLCKE